MRILHVAAGNLYGGVERILVEIATARAAGARHEFALSFEGRLARDLERVGAVVHRLGEARFSRPWSVWRARRRLRPIVAGGAFAAVICHAPWSYALAAQAVAPARRVLWAHDGSAGDHWTEKRVARTPPAVAICNSAFTAGALHAWLRTARVEVLYAPVSAPASDAGTRAEVRRELAADEGTTVFMIASRFERWKGHLELLRAAARVTGEWAVWIAGGTQRASEAGFADELRREIRKLGVDARVRMLGERADVRRLLYGADVHVQPNTSPEPFGIAFVEALWAGLPVVTTAFGGALEIVTPACGVLVKPGDGPALRAALQQFVDDPGFRRRLGAAGPARAAELCDAPRQMLRLNTLVASTLGAEA